MVIAMLALQSVLQLGIGLSFAFVASAVRGRPASTPDARLALRAFLAWWYGFGAYIGILGFTGLLASVGFAPYWMFFLARMVDIPFLSIALWGMLTYVIYMWRGRAGVWRGAAMYAGGLALLYYLVTFFNTDGVAVNEWSAGLVDKVPLYMNIVYVYFAIPLIGSIFAFGALVRRVRGSEQRYRIVMVATSMLLWVVSGLFGEMSGNRALAFATISAFGIATSIVLVFAYRPPRSVREWLQQKDLKREFSAREALEERAALPAWGPEH